MNFSTLFDANAKDLIHSVMNGAFIGVVGLLYTLSQTPDFSLTELDWGKVVNYAVVGAIGALAKRFSSNSDGKVFGKIG